MIKLLTFGVLLYCASKISKMEAKVEEIASAQNDIGNICCEACGEDADCSSFERNVAGEGDII